MDIDHIGYLTNSIEITALDFVSLGYEKGECFNDDNQKTRICFMTKKGETKVELVEPYEENTKMQKQFSKQGGVAPYHLCFIVDDMNEAVEEMSNNGFIPLFKPVEAIAFNNSKICYFWKKTIGFVELLEK